MKKMISFLIFCLSFQNAMAGEPFSDQLVQTPKLAAPKRGSLKGDFADLGEKALDPSTGSFSVSLPISFPSERGSLLAPTSISYSPSFGLSEFGLGWSMQVSAYRSVEFGQINFTDDDLVTPWGRLVLGSDGYYYSKDLKKRIRAELSGRELTIFLPDGKVATLGHASDDTFNDIHLNGSVYSWYLNEVEDPVGRLTRYHYQRFSADSRSYVTAIEYGGLGDDFQYKVQFDYELAHRPLVKNHLGKRLTLSHRVEKIRILSNEAGTFQERYHYHLGFDNGEESPGFYLSSTQKVFASGESEPLVTFDYDQPKEFLLETEWKRDSSLDVLGDLYKGILTLQTQTRTVDFNLDGRPDLEVGKLYTRYLRTDTGFEEETLPAPAGEVGKWCLLPQVNSRTPRQFLQFHGAGTEQLVYKFFSQSAQGVLQICHANGEFIQFVVLPKYWDETKTTLFYDVNKDTKPDIVHLNNKFIQYMYNTSDGSNISFSSATSKEFLNLPSKYHSAWVRDINGDGADDLVLKGDSTIYVHLGLAGGGFATDYVTYDFYLPNGRLNSKKLDQAQVLFIDMNKDGLPDILLQGEGFITLHINTGLFFQQLTIGGLFTHRQLYQNMMVADLGATGGTQLASTFRDGEENYVLTLDLDRPSLGLLTSVDDGKGNQVEFDFEKSAAEAGVPNRKTVVKKITRTSIGEGSVEQNFSYSQVAVHSLTKSFLGFQDVETVTPNQGEVKTTFSYSAQDLQKIETTESLDFERPNFIRFSENTYSDLTYQGITFPVMSSKGEGFKTADGSSVSEKNTVITTDATTLCETQTAVTAGGLNLTTATTHTTPAAFVDHLSCLSSSQTISSSGANSFSHAIHFTRDAQGRVTQVRQGETGSTTTVQDITYGANGRLASIDNAATGTTSVDYDSSYRITKVTNPDATSTEITSFEFLNDQPKTMRQKRDSETFDSEFRFDGLGRLEKNWDSLSGFSESTPQVSLDYEFASGNKPGKIFQTSHIEKTNASFGQFESLFLETARGKELAQLIETSSHYRVSGLTEFDNQQLITKKFQDHLVSSATDLDLLEVSDLDFAQTAVSVETKELLGGVLSQTEAVQSGVERLTEVDKAILAGGVQTLSKVNNSANLVTTTTTNELGHLTKYADQDDQEYLYERDSLGRIRKITFPDGIEQVVSYETRFGKISEIQRDHVGKVLYTYDSATTLLSEKQVYDKNNLLNRKASFTYDSKGRVLTKTLRLYNSSGSVTETLVFNYEYDGSNLASADQPGQTGFLTGVSSSQFSKKTVYRLDGKVLKQELTIPGKKRFLTTLDYFAQGDVKSKREQVFNDPSGTQIVDYTLDYEYDRFGNLVSLKKGGSSFASFSYNDFNEVEAATITGGKELKYFYDGVTRKLNDYREENSGATLFKQTMSWNDRGLIESSNYTLGSRNIMNTYAYTDLGFLSSQSQTDSGGTAKSHTYNFDEGSSSVYYGTLTSSNVNGTLKPIAITATSWTVNGTTYGLDHLGRVISKGSKNFVYGASGRIKEAKNGATLLGTYHYDEAENPVLKEISGGGYEVYLGDNTFAGGDFFEPIKIGSRMVGYFKNGVFTATSQDHLNSFVLDESGSYNSSSPFGVRASHTAEASKVMDFTLKGYDGDIEAVRMGRRWYDPVAKRFLTPDYHFFEKPDEIVRSPIEGGLYSYAGNDPINKLDPTGNTLVGTVVGGFTGALVAAGLEARSTSRSEGSVNVVKTVAAGLGGLISGAAVGTNPLAAAGANAAGETVRQAINSKFGEGKDIDFGKVGKAVLAGFIGGKVASKITGFFKGQASSLREQAAGRLADRAKALEGKRLTSGVVSNKNDIRNFSNKAETAGREAAELSSQANTAEAAGAAAGATVETFGGRL